MNDLGDLAAHLVDGLRHRGGLGRRGGRGQLGGLAPAPGERRLALGVRCRDEQTAQQAHVLEEVDLLHLLGLGVGLLPEAVPGQRRRDQGRGERRRGQPGELAQGQHRAGDDLDPAVDLDEGLVVQPVGGGPRNVDGRGIGRLVDRRGRSVGRLLEHGRDGVEDGLRRLDVALRGLQGGDPTLDEDGGQHRPRHSAKEHVVRFPVGGGGKRTGSASCTREHGRAVGHRSRHRRDEDRWWGGRPLRPGVRRAAGSHAAQVGGDRHRGHPAGPRLAVAGGPRHRGRRGRRGRHRPVAGGPDAVGTEQRLPRLGDPRRAGARDGPAGGRRQRRERGRLRRGPPGRHALPADAVHHRGHRNRRRPGPGR